MITETNAVAFRQNLGEMLAIVQYRNDSVLIRKDGKAVAALIDAKLFERIRRMQERFDALCERLATSYDGVPEADALAEIERATAGARRETADAWRAAGRLPALPVTAPAQKKAGGRRAGNAKPADAPPKPTRRAKR